MFNYRMLFFNVWMLFFNNWPFLFNIEYCYSILNILVQYWMFFSTLNIFVQYWMFSCKSCMPVSIAICQKWVISVWTNHVPPDGFLQLSGKRTSYRICQSTVNYRLQCNLHWSHHIWQLVCVRAVSMKLSKYWDN